MTGIDLDALRQRHFPRVSTLDRSRHLATCEYGYWRDGKRPVPCSKHCRADHAMFDALVELIGRYLRGELREAEMPTQLELLAS